jgi:hypothetical protein
MAPPATAVPLATVSVVVPTCNRAACPCQCLDSLQAQTVPPLEILVVDDGSTDDTARVAPRQATPLTHAQTFAALCHRLQVMGNHGCVPELLEDAAQLTELAELPALTEPGHALPAQGRAGVARAMPLGWVCGLSSNDWPAFLRAVQSWMLSHRRRPGRRAAIAASPGNPQDPNR